MNPRAGPECKNFTSSRVTDILHRQVVVKSWCFRGLRASYAAYTYQDPKQRHSGPGMDVEAMVGGSFPSC